MKSFAAVSIVFASACASTGIPAVEGTPATPQLSLSTDHAIRRSFPERLSEARLPTADRQRLAGTHTAAVRLCVAPDGSVHSLDVTRSSGSAQFDDALATDLARWEYEPYAAPAGLKVCELFNVSYIAD
jgi:TonB family protein